MGDGNTLAHDAFSCRDVASSCGQRRRRRPADRYGRHVRWDELFADIESQLEQELDAERLDLAAEEERLRLGRLTLRDRLEAMAQARDTVKVMLADAETIELRIDSTGRDWIAGETRVGEGVRAIVVPTAAVVAVLPTGDQLE